MSASTKSFLKIACEFSELADSFGISNKLENETDECVYATTDKIIQKLDQLRKLEKEIETIKATNFGIYLQKKKMEMDTSQCAVSDVAHQIQKDCEFLVENKDKVRKTMLTSVISDGKSLVCKNPESVVQLTQTLHNILSDLDQLMRQAPSAAQLETVLQNMEKSIASARDVICDIKNCYESLKSDCDTL